MEPYIICFITVDDQDKAAQIARAIVEKRIAACANIVHEIKSIYMWKGELCQEKEVLIIAKTRRALFGKLRDTVKAIHPYEVPEIISLTIDQGLPEYLAWIDDCTETRN